MDYRTILTALTLCMAAVSATSAEARGPVWEVVTASSGSSDLPRAQVESFDVTVSDGAVYITASEPVKVEVFTILGQRVTNYTVKPGIVKLSLPQRGIYIIRGAGITRRISL